MNVDRWKRHKLLIKLKLLKGKTKDWALISYGDVEAKKASVLGEIQSIDMKEEAGSITEEERIRRHTLKGEFQRMLREEEIKWSQRSRCKWLKKGEKNT